MSRAQGTEPPPTNDAAQSDPVEVLLDFLLSLRRFVEHFGPREAPVGLEEFLQRNFGKRGISERRSARREIRERVAPQKPLPPPKKRGIWGFGFKRSVP